MAPQQDGIDFPALGFGGGTLGDPDAVIPEAQAIATLECAYEAGIRHFDTAPWYGNTKSEHRIGTFLRSLPSHEDCIVTTKVGRVYFRPEDPQAFKASPWMARWKGGLPFDLRFDYSHAGIMRSYEDSLMRLGVNRVAALTIHDLDLKHQKDEDGVAKAFRALEAGRGFQALADLKRSGEIEAIGAGINHIGMIPRFLERFDLDYAILAMPYTLLDQAALEKELPLCVEKDVKVIIGAVFASGILATGSKGAPLYGYKPAAQDILDRVQGIEAICRRHAVPLPAAALQFPLAHPAVVSVIPGANSPDQVRGNIDCIGHRIPDTFWQELKGAGLIQPDAPVPAGGPPI